MNKGLASIVKGKFLLLIAAAISAMMVLPSTANAGSGTFDNGSLQFLRLSSFPRDSGSACVD